MVEKVIHRISKITAALTLGAGLLLSAFLPANACAADDKSITLYCRQNDTILDGMQWSLYRVGTRDGSNIDFVPELEGYSMDLGDLSAESTDTAAKTIGCYIIAAGVSPLAKGYTNAEGELEFGSLSSGLYLAKGKVLHVDNKWYFPSTLLIEVNDANFSLSYDAYPKFYYETETDREKSYTVKKVWIDDEPGSKKRPISITVDLYKDGEFTDSVTLDETNNWEYTWDSLEAGAEWTVAEHEIPVPYRVLIDSNRTQYLVRNSFDPGIPLDSSTDEETTEPTGAAATETATTVTTGTETVATQTTPTTAAATETTPSKLAQTGQLWWPVIPLSLGGILLIGTGIAISSGKKKDEK